MANHYDVPTWAGKPPVGTHLDVMKDDKLVQKLMLDEKKCYLFGRNPQMNDFCIDHQSCSRVHAAFVYHKQLHRAFLVDLGSTHGTFIGSLRLDAHRPTQLAPDSTFHFGASTRNYVMRQRPQANTRNVIEQLEKGGERTTEGGAAMLGLPETETELDNLTEFNTAHNRRISMLGIGEDGESGDVGARGGPGGGKGVGGGGKRRRRGVTFNEEEEVINPEDVDPSVGKFRNMVHSTVIPSKRNRMDGIGPTSGLTNPEEKLSLLNPMKHLHPSSVAHQLYGDIPGGEHVASPILSSALATRLGISLPNPAPDVELGPAGSLAAAAAAAASAAALPSDIPQAGVVGGAAAAAAAASAAAANAAAEALIGPEAQQPSEPRKKKYAKEAWPGKKTVPALLV